MFIEKSFTIHASDDKRVIQSDNSSTYLAFSDMNDEFDGVWSHGFHLFRSFKINEKMNTDKKKLTPFCIEMVYKNAQILSCMLFKNNQGLLLDPGVNSYQIKYVNKKRRKVVRYDFTVDGCFKFIEFEKNVLFLEYSSPQRDGFGLKRLFVGLTVDSELSIINPTMSDTGFNFVVANIHKSKKSPSLYILYSGNYNNLKSSISCNASSQDVLIKQHINNSLLPVKYSGCKTNNKLINKAITHATVSASSFVMAKNGNIGIWAGYPWFDNCWGRDTFISLPGISFVTGRYEIGSHIIGNFLKYQNNTIDSDSYGKVPNVIFSDDNILYNTGDATPLLIRELYEYFLYTGDIAAVMSVWNNIITAIDNVYISKKDSNNFIMNDDADDWMDARILGKDSYSPRGDKQVEIQSLWFTVLHAAGIMAKEILKRKCEKKPVLDNINIEQVKQKRDFYIKEAEKLSDSFKKYFITAQSPFIYDHLNTDYTPDEKIRPNVLLAIYYNDMPGVPELIDKNTALKSFKVVVNSCLFKHGVASLDKNDTDFHPLHISRMYHKDAAYHNGSIWLWLSGIFVHAAVKFGYTDFSFAHTKLLANELLYGKTPGTLSELYEPFKKDGKITPSGTYSQAWSVSEFTRSFYQDYLGIKPDVPERKLYITPAIPVELGGYTASVRYGNYENISVKIQMNKRKRKISTVEIEAFDIIKPIEVIIRVNAGIDKSSDKNSYKFVCFTVLLKSIGAQVKIDFDLLEKNRLKLKDLFISNNSELITMGTDTVSYNTPINDGISYLNDLDETEILLYKSLTEKNYLDKKILMERFDPIKRFGAT